MRFAPILLLALLAGCTESSSIFLGYTKIGDHEGEPSFDPGSTTGQKTVECGDQATYEEDFDVVRGDVQVVLRDGKGAEIVTRDLGPGMTGEGNIMVFGDPGEWRLIVTRTDFGGSYEFGLRC